MNYTKAVGFGVLLWLIMFAVVSAVIDQYNAHVWMRLLIAVVGGVVSYVLAGFVKLNNRSMAVAYALVWVAVGVILDAVVTMRFNADIFSSKSLWLGYLLVLLAPQLGVKEQDVIL